jgi:hypothetical protein
MNAISMTRSSTVNVVSVERNVGVVTITGQHAVKRPATNASQPGRKRRPTRTTSTGITAPATTWTSCPTAAPSICVRSRKNGASRTG